MATGYKRQNLPQKNVIYFFKSHSSCFCPRRALRAHHMVNHGKLKSWIHCLGEPLRKLLHLSPRLTSSEQWPTWNSFQTWRGYVFKSKSSFLMLFFLSKLPKLPSELCYLAWQYICTPHWPPDIYRCQAGITKINKNISGKYSISTHYYTGEYFNSKLRIWESGHLNIQIFGEAAVVCARADSLLPLAWLHRYLAVLVTRLSSFNWWMWWWWSWYVVKCI